LLLGLLLPVTVFHGGSLFASEGMAVLRNVEKVCKEMDSLLREDEETFRAFAERLIEKKIGEPAYQAVAVLEALRQGAPEWDSLRARAGMLPSSSGDLRRWGRDELKRRMATSLRRWERLLEVCAKKRLGGTGRKIARICIALKGNHKKARKFLRQVRKGRGWIGAFDKAMASKGRRNHPAWGYVTQKEEENLDQGLRPFGEAWLPSEEEEVRKRSWGEALRFEEEMFHLITTLPYNAGLAVYHRLRRDVSVIRDCFGDSFQPAASETPCRVFLGRNSDQMVEILHQHELSPVLGSEASLYNPSTHSVISRADSIEILERGVDKALYIFNPVSRDLLYWFVMSDPDSTFGDGPGDWALKGAGLLMETDNLLVPHCDREISRFRDFMDLKKLPTIAELVTMNQEELGRRLESYGLILALVHYFFHGTELVYRARYVAYLKDVMTESPTDLAVEALGMMKPGLRENVVDYLRNAISKK
jgi:hypothetical protein